MNTQQISSAASQTGVTTRQGDALIFTRRPWITGAGYQLVYSHTADGSVSEKIFKDEAEADLFATEHGCTVKHRIVLTAAEERQADRAAGLAFRAGKSSYNASRRRYDNG